MVMFHAYIHEVISLQDGRHCYRHRMSQDIVKGLGLIPVQQ